MSLWNRFRGRSAAPSPAPAPAPAAVPIEEQAAARRRLQESLRALVGPGFRTREEARELAEELAGDDPALGADDAQEALAAVWGELEVEQRGWRDEGDYERLRDAFADLQAAGVVARMAFACCQTCGHAEIGDQRTPGAWGYTFFHDQDAERLAPGGSDLYLAFGSYAVAPGLDPDLVDRAEAGDQEARREVADLSELAVAQRVVDTLREHGLSIDWDGTAGQRIRVPDLDWRKPLPA